MDVACSDWPIRAFVLGSSQTGQLQEVFRLQHDFLLLPSRVMRFQRLEISSTEFTGEKEPNLEFCGRASGDREPSLCLWRIKKG
jgi:hypothetical protein